MISLTSLQDAENGSLFHMDCSFLSSVRYCCESPDTVCLIFPEKPTDLPERVFLMPDGKQYDYRAFIYTLSEGAEVCSLRDEADGNQSGTEDAAVKPAALKEYSMFLSVRPFILTAIQKKPWSPSKISDAEAFCLFPTKHISQGIRCPLSSSIPGILCWSKPGSGNCALSVRKAAVDTDANILT